MGSQRNNVVFSVLPTSVTSLLAEGQNLSALQSGQLGFFDAKTNTAFDHTSAVIPKEILIALGKGTPTGTPMRDFRQSAGQEIQLKGVINYTRKNYQVGSPMVAFISGIKDSKCETTYGIRANISNAHILQQIGFNQFNQNLYVTTGCCDCEEGCATYDGNLVVKLFVEEAAKNPNSFYSVVAYAVDTITAATHGTTANYAINDLITNLNDLVALAAYNDTQTTVANKVYAGLRITTLPAVIKDFCQISLDYHKFLETSIQISLLNGFACSGATVVTSGPIYSEGNGKNVMRKEYLSSGWNGSGPYLQSAVTGLSFNNIEYLSKSDVNYTQFTLEYDVNAGGGFLEYTNPLSTIIAVPSADTTLATNIETVLQAIVANS